MTSDRETNKGQSAADAAIGPRYKLAEFLTAQDKVLMKQIILSFIWDKYCHVWLCLHLIDPNWPKYLPQNHHQNCR